MSINLHLYRSEIAMLHKVINQYKEENEKLTLQQKSAKIMNETLDDLIKEKIDELQEENKNLKEDNEKLKEEIYTIDPETSEFTDIKKGEVLSQKLSDIYEIFEDETKGYCLYHGECEFEDFLCILQKSRDNAEKYELKSEEEEELMCEACHVTSGLFVHPRGNVCLCEICGINQCVDTSEEDNCDRCRKE